MLDRDIKILEECGWEIECESPCEISHPRLGQSAKGLPTVGLIADALQEMDEEDRVFWSGKEIKEESELKPCPMCGGECEAYQNMVEDCLIKCIDCEEFFIMTKFKELNQVKKLWAKE